MIKRSLFKKRIVSSYDFRVLADEELYMVIGGTGFLESEGTEAEPEVQCDASNSGSAEEKLADLASQAVTSVETPFESAPVETTFESAPVETTFESATVDTPVETPVETPFESNTTPTSETTTIDDQINAIQSSMDSNTNEAQTSAADSVLNSYTEGIENRNESADNSPTVDINAQAEQAISIQMTDMRSQAVGLVGQDPSVVSVANKTEATAALKVIDNALQRQLNQQATIDAVNNRLQFESTNLTVESYNLQSAESTYRDADMAKEMTELTKNNIMMQSATAMLAQATQQNQNNLSLLQ